MAGQDFTYQFDDIGNRDTTGGRASAVSDYSANQLNQYETRTVPNKLDILGVANPGFGVQVWKDSDSPSTASRSGEYFHNALTVAYSSYPEVFAKSLFVPNQQASAGRSFVPPATEQFFHDLDGNLIQDGRWTAYMWDGENRLIEMKRDAGTPLLAQQRLTFEYDHLGRRVRKRFFTPSGTNWSEQRVTIYLYDGWNLVAELDGNSANATLRTYVWGTDLSGSRSGAGGVGGLLWVNNSQTTGGLPTGIQFVAYDGNGNVVGLTSATDGSNTARYEYGPFGEPLRTTGPLAAANPIRWSTKATDDESGLVYYGFRYYSSATGRWPNRDPITELGFLLQQTGRQLFQDGKSDAPPVGVEDDDPDINQLLVGPGGLNAYGFNGNNAIIFVDYLGLAPFCVCVRAAGDHAWIVVTDLATGEVNSYGRYKARYGKPPADHSGVHKDMVSDRMRKFDAQRCITVQSFKPTVDSGYDLFNNNCATYAASEWKRASGESLSVRNTDWGHPDYDDPEKLVDAINTANAGKKKSEDCCGKAPAK